MHGGKNMARGDGTRQAEREKQSNPIPTGIMVALAGVFFTNALSSTVLLPFAAFMVADFKVAEDESQVGYYAGYLASAFHLGALFSSFFWGALSDRIGRRPVMLAGLLSNIVCALLFGFSTSFHMAIFARFLNGVLASVSGVGKTALSEVSDSTNQAAGFSVIGVTWGMGLLFGPVLGGYLCQPADKYPSIFMKGSLFDIFPFALPCLILAALTASGFVACVTLLPETLGRAKVLRRDGMPPRPASSDGSQERRPRLIQGGGDRAETTAIVLQPPGSNLRRTSHMVGKELMVSIGSEQKGDGVRKSRSWDERSAVDADMVLSRVAFDSPSPTERDGLLQREVETIVVLPVKNPQDMMRENVHEFPVVRDQDVGPGRLRSTEGGSFEEGGDTRQSKGDTACARVYARLHSWFAGQSPSRQYTAVKADDLDSVDGEIRGVGRVDDVESPRRTSEEIRKVDCGGVSGRFVQGKGLPGCRMGTDRHGKAACGERRVREGRDGEESVDCLGGLQAVLCERDTVISILLYCLIGFSFTSFDEVFPLWSLTKWEAGGLSFGTEDVGLAQTAGGLSLIPFQLFTYPWIVKQIGPLSTLRLSYYMGLSLTVFPLMRFIDNKRTQLIKIIAMVLMMVRSVSSLCGYTSIFILQTNSVRLPQHMGSMNGFSMTAVAVFKGLAPTAGGSLFAWSMGLKRATFPFDYHLCFLLSGFMMIIMLAISLLLPPTIDERKFLT